MPFVTESVVSFVSGSHRGRGLRREEWLVIGAAIFFGVAAIIGGSALVRMAKRRGILPA
ncbi:hypothetical protein [Brevibacterium renqingii]|uniref:hypothetical protein n=1 Tax=Brevibacterium renqingii TaxID=2776916 RepID=UPI001AE07199|nr:hypothetical protein [Brevibacterium renqingii]